ncbi:hypothetical protein JTB14_009160 [Gonioctena quinquepunctata]|nr:hypothetical protein JTB14_009160 [Gonioctena quinquepunctata]
MDDLNRALLISDLDIILITESWLNYNFANSEISNSQYLIFRKDRDYNSTNCTRGGGVMIAIKSSYNPTEIRVSNLFEDVWVKLKINNKSIVLCVVYFVPESSLDAYQRFVEHINEVKRHHIGANFIIVDDFNFPRVTWSYEEQVLIPGYLPNQRVEFLIDELPFMGFQQYNDVKNVEDKILDLVFSDEISIDVRFSDTTLLNNFPTDAYHPPLQLILDFENMLQPTFSYREKVFASHKGDYEGLNSYLTDINWSSILNSEIELAVSTFY